MIIEIVIAVVQCGLEGFSDRRSSRDAVAVPLRKPFFNAHKFIFSGGECAVVLVCKQPGTLADEDEQQQSCENLRFAEALG